MDSRRIVVPVKIEVQRNSLFLLFEWLSFIFFSSLFRYQRPSFVTPPFAGYVSGHSTFSRAAAEILERVTGDAFFPGGMAGLTAKANDFLVFEVGPQKDVNLQWATYRDAADECGLSRIYGGIRKDLKIKALK